MMYRLFFISLFILLSLMGSANAQDISSVEKVNKISPSVKSFNTWSLSVVYGSVKYFGDVFDNSIERKFNDNDWTFGLTLNKSINPVVSFQGVFIKGRMHNSSKLYDVKFDTEFMEYGFGARINLNNLINVQTKKISFFASVGVCVNSYNARSKTLSTDSLLSRFGYDEAGETKTSAINEVVIPLGFGAKYRINKDVDFGVNYNFRTFNSDRLDAVDVMGTFNDRFSYVSVSLIVKLGDNDRFIEWTADDLQEPFLHETKMEKIIETKSEKEKHEKMESVKEPKKQKEKKKRRKEIEETVSEEKVTAVSPMKKYHIVAGIYTDILVVDSVEEVLVMDGYAPKIVTSTKKDDKGNDVTKYYLMAVTSIPEDKVLEAIEKLKAYGFKPRKITAK